MRKLARLLKHPLRELTGEVDEAVSPERYTLLQRKIVALMVAATLIPLTVMAVLNYYEHQKAMTREIQNPLRVLVNKTKNSFELFLAERTSTMSLIASAYTYQELADQHKLARIFSVMKREFEGFVDLGLIDENGVQVNYVGPYNLKGIDFSEQRWFQEVRLKGKYVSDVFLGFRQFPHVIVAVQHMAEDGRVWILRATLDTKQFERIIAGMGLEPDADAFLVNTRGLLQTNSNNYGKVLESMTLPLPPQTFEPNVLTMRDPRGREVFLSYAYFADADFVLMAVKPRSSSLKTWYTVRGDLLFIFVAGVVVVLIAAMRVTDALIQRMKEAEDRRELALREVEHSQKLSSIGRLAAGVAHEVNNPLAIINEKTGLMKDILSMQPDFPTKEKLLAQVDSVLRAVERCRGITHRMLGFARRMDVSIEELDLAELIRETAGFLANEAMHRKVNVQLDLDPELPRIVSDRSQLQQVFLNLLNNALAAVADGGVISVFAKEEGGGVRVTVTDNGCGMSEETMKHIFEPFFTTKKGKGTGLGLSITYGIIKRLGGDISVESTQGVGTTLTITLPKGQREALA
ncbi:two-component system, NtrC family, sensor kinase [Humidesulfovibrio mexicanus]|uniref:histidine kinase n=1 Tax=Humidesulfovibrio mexicanus TaxID=147047 RepID=A0A238ZZT2_9BACT|nr:PAS domain-containing sensor histidine kinase [Humidesulfovibrio mexicanus]SNR88662.1 two-component system, NtrC family, sensor kinase [Humidesulfovibrio mexicanus]